MPYSIKKQRGKTWLKFYKTYVKSSMIYAYEAWRPTTKEGIEKLESVQRRALKMAGGLRDRDSYREDCRRAGLNTVEEELEEADMVRTVGAQQKDIRKRSFGSRIQNPWNHLEDRVKQAKSPKAFKNLYKKSKNLV